MPLRFQPVFSSAARWRRLARPVRIVLLVALGGLSLFLFYALSIRWFEHEFSNAVYGLAQQEAARTAQSIAEALPFSLGGDDASDDEDEERAEESLASLVQRYQNVIAAMVSDSHGRIVTISITRGNTHFDFSSWAHQYGDSLRGIDQNSLLRALHRDQPNLEPVPIRIYRKDGAAIGWLWLLVDRSITQAGVELAAARMTARLTLLLLLLALITALAIGIIQRQRRLAIRLTQQRNEAERLAYVGALAAGLAHEIRNPLNALGMQLELLEEDVEDGAPQQFVMPRVASIRQGLSGVERTVHDFLSFAAPGKQQPSLVDLAPALGQICAEYHESVEPDQLQLDCIVATGLSAWCDPHALRQILGNLLGNAIRIQQSSRPAELARTVVAAESGPMPLRLRVEATRVTDGFGPESAWVNIDVDDAGPGVPAELRERIFDAFFTTRSEGTGLGLPIARRLAEMNGGRLDLAPESSPLGGARFRLRLPGAPRADRH